MKDWQGLLVAMAKTRAVKVRILLSDFDPRNDNNHHQRRSWNSFNKFVAAARAAGLTRDHFQVMVSLHPAVISNIFAAKITRGSLAKVIADFNKKRLAGLENSPGIWGDVELKGGKLILGKKPLLDAFPASHHQKTVIVDSKVGFLGGLNISDYFQDKPDHLKDEPAHDIFCRIEGPVVQDLERSMVGRWNAETAAFNAFVASANTNGKLLGKFRLDDSLGITPLTVSTAARGKAGNALAQIHRTISSGIASNSVVAVRDDIAKAYERAISLANEIIYIENQVMRFESLADWVIARFKANSKLQVILVLPVVPEEIASGTADDISFHGQALQHDALVKMKAALGANLGLYSLLQKKAAPKGKLAFSGSLQIDVHCKIMMVDDVWATVGSANASPRSFTLDSEINVAWHEPDSVKKFREQLWREHLGSADGSLFAAWKPADYIRQWEAIAAKNVKARPALRQGFIVPHDPDLEKGKRRSSSPTGLRISASPTRSTTRERGSRSLVQQ